ncbi:MAG: MFS transporter [Anaerolineae bacterium]|nr:MFS transporter [Anaerolineae bacterium]
MRRPYYGWVITFTLALTEMISWGIIYYAFSVFMTPMQQELGWSSAALNGAFSLFTFISGFAAYPVGSWIDRHGGRALMTLGSACASLLIIAWSQVTDLNTFYLIWFGLGLCAAATLYEPAFAVVATWFTRRRSTALMVITFAAGLASTVFVPLSDALMRAYGWRQATLILGVVLAVTTILPHLLVLRRRPQDFGLLPDGEPVPVDAPPPSVVGVGVREALTSRAFWVVVASFMLSTLAAQAIRVHFIPYLVEAGYDSQTAAYASGAIGLMQVFGRLVFAPLDMRFSGWVMLGGVMLLQVAALLLLPLGASPVIVVVFVVLFGASYGARVLTLGWTLAPVGAGWLHDQTGSYAAMDGVMIVLSVLAVLVLLLAREGRGVVKVRA